MKVETNPRVFSSASGITLLDQETQYRLAMFIAMDPPKHDVQRLVVAPIVAPGNLANMAGTIRERAITDPGSVCRAMKRSTGSSMSRSN